MASIQLPDGSVLHNVHEEWMCGANHCVIHNPSLHHMRDWSMQWHNPTQIFIRQCPHGIMHPDPDSAAYLNRIGQGYKLRHDDCDQCCEDTITIDGEIAYSEILGPEEQA